MCPHKCLIVTLDIHVLLRAVEIINAFVDIACRSLSLLGGCEQKGGHC